MKKRFFWPAILALPVTLFFLGSAFSGDISGQWEGTAKYTKYSCSKQLVGEKFTTSFDITQTKKKIKILVNNYHKYNGRASGKSFTAKNKEKETGSYESHSTINGKITKSGTLKGKIRFKDKYKEEGKKGWQRCNVVENFEVSKTTTE